MISTAPRQHLPTRLVPLATLSRQAGEGLFSADRIDIPFTPPTLRAAPGGW
jgi:hypothetical protein